MIASVISGIIIENRVLGFASPRICSSLGKFCRPSSSTVLPSAYIYQKKRGMQAVTDEKKRGAPDGRMEPRYTEESVSKISTGRHNRDKRK